VTLKSSSRIWSTFLGRPDTDSSSALRGFCLGVQGSEVDQPPGHLWRDKWTALQRTPRVLFGGDRLRFGWLNGFSFITSTGAWKGAARAEDAQGTPTQSHVSPSILLYEGYCSGFGVSCAGRRQATSGQFRYTSGSKCCRLESRTLQNVLECCGGSHIETLIIYELIIYDHL